MSIEVMKQEPVGYLYDWLNPDDRDEVIRDWFATSMCVIEKDKGFNVRPLYTAPVHASDISAERVDETAKDRYEPWVKSYSGGKPNYTTPEDKIVPSDHTNSHQPVAWAKFNQGEITHSEMTDGSGCDFDLKAAGFVPLYTAREWVGLTDHELQVLDFNDPERGKLARAIDAKLKERNT